MTTETTPSEAHTPLPEIENDAVHLTRWYIPLPGGWEMQTKGGGSTYRLSHRTGPEDFERFAVLDSYLHAPLEAMARDIHAAYSAAVNERPKLLERAERGNSAIAFFKDVARLCFDGGSDLDYSDFLSLGQKHGLLKVVPYDESVHGQNDFGLAPGDDFYAVNIPALRAE